MTTVHVRLTFEGKSCYRCGLTLRFVKTRRCVHCQRRYQKQHKATIADRERMRGKPCGICKEPMEQPCFDEVDGTLRGWLCHHCNIGLGQFRERRDLLINALKYLDKHALGFQRMVSKHA